MPEDTDWFVELIKKHKDEIRAILAEEEADND
jgi:hypothetical protein